jgi:hypothetical protein
MVQINPRHYCALTSLLLKPPGDAAPPLGALAGTNDFIWKIGGRAPMTLEEFVEKHRAAFV